MLTGHDQPGASGRTWDERGSNRTPEGYPMSHPMPAPTPIPLPDHFPIKWEHPDHAALPWQQDRMHAPHPMTPLSAWFANNGFRHGPNKALAAYNTPVAFNI